MTVTQKYVRSLGTKRFIELGRELGLLKRGVSTARYFERQFFRDVDLDGRSVLEVGAGNGLASVWAALHGAKTVVALEPTADGATGRPLAHFRRLVQRADAADVISIVEKPVQDLPEGQCFDVVVLRHSVNHLDEPMCIELGRSPRARAAYLGIFRHLFALTAPGGVVVIADCSSRSFWSDIGLTNPFATTIEWHKHQTPELWGDLLRSVGYVEPQIEWMYHPLLPKWPFGLRSLAYFHSNLFRLKMRRPS
jgi:SAM-dependent methyltransferase